MATTPEFCYVVESETDAESATTTYKGVVTFADGTRVGSGVAISDLAATIGDAEEYARATLLMRALKAIRDRYEVGC